MNAPRLDRLKLTPFPRVNPIFDRRFWWVRCPLVTCQAQPGERCREADGSRVVGYYGPCETNVHRARAVKFRLREARR